jgi:hypothetical protein
MGTRFSRQLPADHSRLRRRSCMLSPPLSRPRISPRRRAATSADHRMLAGRGLDSRLRLKHLCQRVAANQRKQEPTARSGLQTEPALRSTRPAIIRGDQEFSRSDKALQQPSPRRLPSAKTQSPPSITSHSSSYVPSSFERPVHRTDSPTHSFAFDQLPGTSIRLPTFLMVLHHVIHLRAHLVHLLLPVDLLHMRPRSSPDRHIASASIGILLVLFMCFFSFHCVFNVASSRK